MRSKDVSDYITERLQENKKVNIEIKGRKSENGYLEMDWLIDKKILLKDFPFETFEGEDLEDALIGNAANLEDRK